LPNGQARDTIPALVKFLRIVGLCIAAACAYGVAHDQVTVRLCIEYFTIAHPRLIDSQSPTVLGLFWGVVATWWVGLGLGVLLGGAARLGRAPRLEPRDVRPEILRVMAGSAAAALLAGVVTFFAARHGYVALPPAWARQLPEAVHLSFLVVAAAHSASYAAGFALALVAVARVVRRRFRLSRPDAPQASSAPRR